MALMMPWTVRHRIRLQDVEQVIEDPLRPKYFTIDMLIGTPIPLRANSAEQAQGWIQIIRNALRPHQELMAARNQELDCVRSSALLCDDDRASNDDEEDSNMRNRSAFLVLRLNPYISIHVEAQNAVLFRLLRT